MREQLITLETAKLAKEKGFHDSWLVYTENGKIYQTYYSEERDAHYPAPTQSLLQKWLRDVHGIVVQVDIVSMNHQVKNNGEFSFAVIHHRERKIPVGYEEALEKGLQKALKEIPSPETS